MVVHVNTLDPREIVVGDRFRKDLGDLEALKESITELGQLQPIGVQLIGNASHLVFGQRRLAACIELGVCVKAIFVNVDRILGEHDENEVRKGFSPSERVAIANAVAERLGNRRGQRTDMELPRSCAEVEPGKETREVAAEAAGMSRDEYRRTKKVINDGVPDLIEAMDSGEISVSRAAEIASLPPEDQFDALSKPHVANNSGNNEWYTPQIYLNAARKVFGGVIDLDPASNELAQGLVQATKWYGIEEDGLQQPWSGSVWLNPPEDLIPAFVDKLLDDLEDGTVTEAILLLNNATETVHAQRLLGLAAAVCFPQGRIKFLDETLAPAHTPSQGQMFVYLGDSVYDFELAFEVFGRIVSEWVP